MKYGGQKMIRVMTGIFSGILEEGQVLQEWTRSRMTLIHKGGGQAEEEIGIIDPLPS